MDDKNVDSFGAVELAEQNGGTPVSANRGNAITDDAEMAYFGKKQQLKVRIPSRKALDLSDRSSGDLVFYLLLDLCAVFCLPGRACLRES
jgi:hypothetical protein